MSLTLTRRQRTLLRNKEQRAKMAQKYRDIELNPTRLSFTGNGGTVRMDGFKPITP